MNAVAEARRSQLADVRAQLDTMLSQFAAVLPRHIPPERFRRVVLTAIQNNPDLLRCERRSLWNACMRAAQDGLLPDGRLGAIVVYEDKDRGPVAQWMPMIAGLRQKVRNSGEIATWDAQVVYANDDFDYQLGDNPHIHHKPALDNRGAVVAAYSIATLKTGERSREVMTVADIEDVRKRSRARRGPWHTDYAEMCRKTVARRHSKSLPMSSDLDDLIRRDDALYEFDRAPQAGAAATALAPPERPRSLGHALDAIADMSTGGGGEPQTPEQKAHQVEDEITVEDAPAATIEDDEAGAGFADQLREHNARLQTAAREGFAALAAAWRVVPDELRPHLEADYRRHKQHAEDVSRASS